MRDFGIISFSCFSCNLPGVRLYPISRIAHSGIAYLFRAKGSPPPYHGTGSSKHFIKRKQSEVFSLQQAWVFFSRDLRVSAVEPTLFPGSPRRSK